jgi:hypothetical protein
LSEIHPVMKNLKILFYIFKWLALIFLTFLIAAESHSKILMYILIGFVAAILIWEGLKEFNTKQI